MIKSHKNKVMLFGSFDYLHEGHLYLLNKAQEYGEKLIIVVAQDIIIKNIKGNTPDNPLSERISQLLKYLPDAKITKGDIQNESWSVIKNYKPEIVVVGYDQEGLKNALIKVQSIYNFKLVQIDSFKPKKYKSSLLKKTNSH